MHNVLWWYAAYRARLTSAALSVEKRRALTLTWLTGPVLYGVAVAVAFFDPRVSIAIFIFLGIAYLLPTPHAVAQAQQARARRRLTK